MKPENRFMSDRLRLRMFLLQEQIGTILGQQMITWDDIEYIRWGRWI